MFKAMTTVKIEHVNIADARGRLDELFNRAAAGETIVIERGDGAAARLTPQAQSASAQKPYDWDEHWKWLERQPLDPRPQQVVIDDWRGRARY